MVCSAASTELDCTAELAASEVLVAGVSSATWVVCTVDVVVVFTSSAFADVANPTILATVANAITHHFLPSLYNL